MSVDNKILLMICLNKTYDYVGTSEDSIKGSKREY